MRNFGQVLPDHAAVLTSLNQSQPVTAAAQVRPGTVVRLSGTAEPGAGGVLTAPLSGRPCVWFRTVQRRDLSELSRVVRDIAPIAPPMMSPMVRSDMTYLIDDETRDVESPAPFVVADASGTVTVDPVRIDVDAPTVSVDRVSGDGFDQRWVVEREWIIEPGSPLFVCGAVVADASGAVLRATPQTAAVVSGLDEQAVWQRATQVVAALPAAMASNRQVARLLVAVVVVVMLVAAAVVLAIVG